MQNAHFLLRLLVFRSPPFLHSALCTPRFPPDPTLVEIRCYGKENSWVKALANEDTLLHMMFLGMRKLGNICCGHKMFVNKIRNIFCVPDTKFVSATNNVRAGKRGKHCVGNNVSLRCPVQAPFLISFSSLFLLFGVTHCSRRKSIPFLINITFKCLNPWSKESGTRICFRRIVTSKKLKAELLFLKQMQRKA